MLISLSVLPGGGDFTLSARRSTVLPGEGVFLDAESPSGFSSTWDEKELDWLWDFDQVGASFAANAPYSDANYFRGPVAVTSYPSAGTYNPACTIRSAVTSATKSLAITVQNPDVDVSWDRDVYVSFAGNTTGWPTETGAVEHITSAAEWQGLSFSTASEVVRITFRDDETYTWTTLDTKSLAGGAATYYVTRDFAGTNPPNLQASATSTDAYAAFTVNRTSNKRIVLYGLDVAGGYDPLTGSAPNGNFKLLDGATPTGAVDPEITISGCSAAGASLAITNGTSTANGPTHVAVIDSICTDWPDYGVGLFGGEFDARFSGCDIRQNPLALVRDGKSGSFPQAADHGPIRIGNNLKSATHNCRLYSNSGWSPFYGADIAVQPGLRIHPIAVSGGWSAYVFDCDILSAWRPLVIGDVDTGSAVQSAGKFIVSANTVTGGRQARQGLIFINAASGVVTNNVIYHPNLEHFGDLAEGVCIQDGAGPAAARAGDFYVAFNTMASQRTTESYSDVGTGSWSGVGTITQEYQLVSADGHTNSGAFTDYSPISKADNFKPVTTSAAIDAVTTGFVPVRDFDGNLRAATTNIGAHHDDVASDAGVSAPSNSVAPTIAELANWSGEYAVSSLGTWANSEDYFLMWNWQMDGVDVAIAADTDVSQLVTCDVSTLDDSTGNLTCRITMTNRSGTRTTATSNTIAV